MTCGSPSGSVDGEPLPLILEPPVRLLFSSHDGLGLGHVRRNLAIARAVVEAHPDASVLLVSSAGALDSLGIPPRVDVLRLPSVRKVDNSRYESRHLRMTASQTWSLRSALIASATRSFAPHVLLADKHPHGAHGELREALGVLHAAGGRAVLGLRDVLDSPATVRAEWQQSRVPAAIASDYDRVLVYGSPEVLDVARAYDLPPAVAGLLRYVGYVATRPTGEPAGPLCAGGDGRPVVLATAGGGADGYAALSAFVTASRDAPWTPVVVSGSDAPAADAARLQAEVEAVGGVHHRFLRDLPGHLGRVDALVSMGGYNTVCEALQARVPTVVVPRVAPRQEQQIRARAFAGLGLLECVEPDRLDGLGDAVLRALRVDRAALGQRVEQTLDLDGARRAAAHLLALASAEQLGELPAGPVAPVLPLPSPAAGLERAVDVAV